MKNKEVGGEREKTSRVCDQAVVPPRPPLAPYPFQRRHDPRGRRPFCAHLVTHLVTTTMQALRTSVTVNRGQALASTARVARQGRANLVCRAKVRIRVFRRVRRYDQVTGTDTFVTRWRGVLIAARSGERLGSKHGCNAHVATFCGEYGGVFPWMCIVMCQCLSNWRNMPAAGRRDDGTTLAHSLCSTSSTPSDSVRGRGNCLRQRPCEHCAGQG